MSNHKLAIIVPYRDRREHLDIFIPHIQEFLNNKNIDYKIYVIEQSDDKPFNYGKLCNSAFHLLKDEYDYFCFHDVDMLPINDSCDYSYPTNPIHLATRASAHNDRLPYLQYFGGVTIFPKEDFEKINGYSNEYYGWGMEDIDLLYRCSKSDIPMEKQHVYPRIDSNYNFDKIQKTDSFKTETIKYLSFDGETFLSVVPNKELKNITNESFTVSCWINVPSKPKNEQYIISWPGFNSGISYQIDGTLRFNFWNEDKLYFFNYESIEPNKWHHIVFNLNYDEKKIKLWINNLQVEEQIDSKVIIKFPLWDYSRDLLYIGCGSHNAQFFIGNLANVYMFDYNLSQTEITNLYLNGLEYNKTYQTKFEPVLRYEFDNFYKQILIDKSKNHNHAKFFGKAGNDYLNFVDSAVINKTTKISLPIRIEGEYQSLEHNDDINIASKFYSYDPDITENKEIFFKDIMSGEYSTNKIGLNNLKFKLVKQESLDEKTEWLKIIL
jgi:hypothetical protein